MEEIKKLKEELEQIKLLLDDGEIDLVNRLLRYNRAINAIEELAKNNDKVNSIEIKKIIKRKIKIIWKQQLLWIKFF